MKDKEEGAEVGWEKQLDHDVILTLAKEVGEEKISQKGLRMPWSSKTVSFRPTGNPGTKVAY